MEVINGVWFGTGADSSSDWGSASTVGSMLFTEEALWQSTKWIVESLAINQNSLVYDSWLNINRIWFTDLILFAYSPTGDGMNAYVAYKVTTQVSPLLVAPIIDLALTLKSTFRLFLGISVFYVSIFKFAQDEASLYSPKVISSEPYLFFQKANTSM